MCAVQVPDTVQLIKFSEVMEVGKDSGGIKFSKIKYVTVLQHHSHSLILLYNIACTDTSQQMCLQFSLRVAAQETLKDVYSLEAHGTRGFPKLVW